MGIPQGEAEGNEVDTNTIKSGSDHDEGGTQKGKRDSTSDSELLQLSDGR